VTVFRIPQRAKTVLPRSYEAHVRHMYLVGVYLTGVYLTSVHLTGVYLIDVYLIGVYFIDVYIFPNLKRLWRSL
jgi:hypothetical protein